MLSFPLRGKEKNPVVFFSFSYQIHVNGQAHLNKMTVEHFIIGWRVIRGAQMLLPGKQIIESQANIDPRPGGKIKFVPGNKQRQPVFGALWLVGGIDASGAKSGVHFYGEIKWQLKKTHSVTGARCNASGPSDG